MDPNRETGFVIDFHAWVAPGLPFLLEVANYLPCNLLCEEVHKDRRWTLIPQMAIYRVRDRWSFHDPNWGAQQIARL